MRISMVLLFCTLQMLPVKRITVPYSPTAQTWLLSVPRTEKSVGAVGVLTAFQEVEDNLAALNLLAQEAQVQQEAVNAARQSAVIANNQYRAGTANYLAVVVLQANALNSERTFLAITARRLTASVDLVRALGGGWNAASLAAAE